MSLRARAFFTKLQGTGASAPPPPMLRDAASLKHIATCSVGAMLGMGSLTLLHKVTGSTDVTMALASSGATAILLFAAPTLPFSQPRNVVGGHLLAASSGLVASQVLGGVDAMATPSLAVGLAVFSMLSTSCLHPPAGGTALIAAASGSPFILVPVFVTSVTQVAVACLWHNSTPATSPRRYPQYW